MSVKVLLMHCILLASVNIYSDSVEGTGVSDVSWEYVSGCDLIVEATVSKMVEYDGFYEVFLDGVTYVKGVRSGNILTVKVYDEKCIRQLEFNLEGRIVAFLRLSSRVHGDVLFAGGASCFSPYDVNLISHIEELVDIEGKLWLGALKVDYPKSEFQAGRIRYEISRLRSSDDFDQAFGFLLNLDEAGLVYLVDHLGELALCGKHEVSSNFHDVGVVDFFDGDYYLYVSDVLRAILFYRYRFYPYNSRGDNLESRCSAYRGWMTWAWYKSNELNSKQDAGDKNKRQ